MHLSQPTPELKVPDVKIAQAYYRDCMGFEIKWYDQAGDIGAVAHGDCSIFFRKSDRTEAGQTFWMFSKDVDHAYAELGQLGANITDPIGNKPWGMRQFTMFDPYGNQFYVFHDL